jgi:hypothetical protein
MTRRKGSCFIVTGVLGLGFTLLERYLSAASPSTSPRHKVFIASEWWPLTRSTPSSHFVYAVDVETLALWACLFEARLSSTEYDLPGMSTIKTLELSHQNLQFQNKRLGYFPSLERPHTNRTAAR